MDRTVYATYSSYDRALDALESAWACGDILDCDDADIVRDGGRWSITIKDRIYEY